MKALEGFGAIAFASKATRVACAALMVLLVCAPGAQVQAQAPAQSQSEDVAARAAQARALLATPQGAALLDLLGDPAVRQHLIDAPMGAPVAAEQAAHRPVGSMGPMLDRMLGDTREQIINLGTQVRLLPAALAGCWDELSALMPPPDRHAMLFYLIVFIAGGVAAQRVFLLVSRPWLAHFNRLSVATLSQRVGVLFERLAFGILMVGAFAAGSMGTFMLFDWPASSGAAILGFLWATLLIRLSHLVSRFIMAPGAERLRLVPISTRQAWFWHRWMAALVSIGALGWQTIVFLRGLGLPHDGVELLRHIVLLALVLCGIVIVWTRPPNAQPDDAHPEAPRANEGSPEAHSPRRTIFRVLMSCGLLLVWLLFLTEATAAAWSLLVIGAAPIVLFVLRNAAARVTGGQWLHEAGEVSAVSAIADRCMQALVAVVTAFALIEIWQIDPSAVAASDTAMTRLGRGAFEALVILLGADLLWQVVRVVIDLRLNGAVVPIDNLDDDELRRRARIRTLLPVLRNFVFVFVLIIAILSALAAMGLQIGPLLAGAGVVGIAVGFGAQTLVRDVLSGVFFLLDDAFRVGELIESGGISGTVETFSLRSVKLRHYKGPLHTVPFGDLKAITNFSRDWVNELVEVTVAFETDLERVEQAIERVSDDVMQEPSLASRIISPPVSIGVTAMDVAGIHVGVIVRTRPGAQFKVRAAVYRRLKSAFDADGIRFFGQTVVPQVDLPV
jgi:small-conductance mechanosensitive channel